MTICAPLSLFVNSVDYLWLDQPDADELAEVTVGDDRSSTVVAHYSHGGMLAAVLRGLAATGKPTDRIDSDDLAAGDEFHATKVANLVEAMQRGILAPTEMINTTTGD
jgi:hypothetical protein